MADRNTDRGSDSWGFATDDSIHKGIGRITGMSQKHWHSLIGGQVVLAHTRWATTGFITRENSHPFRCDRIVGAHNGTVDNHDKLNAFYGRQCKVDSEHLFWHLAEERSLEEIEAYGALEWTDEGDPGAVYLARFHGGELAIAKTKIGVIWSSKAADLKLAIRLAGWKAEHYQVEENRLYVAKEGALWDIGPFQVGKPTPKITLKLNDQDPWSWQPQTARHRDVPSDDLWEHRDYNGKDDWDWQTGEHRREWKTSF